MAKKRIYLDNAATTRMDDRVFSAMQPYFVEEFGNPSALYEEGVRAREAVEAARGSIADNLLAHSNEILFTSGGTESDNLVLQGVAGAFAKENGVVPHIVLSQIEHPALLRLAESLEAEGAIELSLLQVDSEGIVSVKALRDLLQKNTALVSVMYVNNEIGTVQPIKEIARVLRAHRKENKTMYPFFHTDACQAANYFSLHVDRLGVDLLTVTGSKIYGPKGNGFVYVRNGVSVEPVLIGGGQERGMRAGTENVPGIVGLAEAFSIAEESRNKESARLADLQDYFFKELEKNVPDSRVNGSREFRAPNNVHISLPGIENDVVVIEMDARGIACSAQSACKAGADGESHVILALGRGDQGTQVRFTMGRETTKRHIDRAVEALLEIINKYSQK